jgi:hypothetical protein
MKVTRNESAAPGGKPITLAPRVTGAAEKSEVRPAYAEGDAVRVDVVFAHAFMRAVDTAGYEPGGEDGSDTPLVVAAVGIFAEKYNLLQDILLSGLPDGFVKTSDELREAVYRPVKLESSASTHISLYEIGVAHSPDNVIAGRLSINEEKLASEYQKRRKDVKTLFVKKEDGLLFRMNAMLSSLTGMPADRKNGAGKLYGLLCSRINGFTEACEGIWGLFGNE